MICGTLFELLRHRRRREWFGGDAAGERGVIVDVEFEEVEERVVDEVDGAVDFLLDAEEEFEGPARFVAGWEGDVGELAGCIVDVFAGVAVGLQMSGVAHSVD